MKTHFDQNNAAGKEQIWVHEMFTVWTDLFFKKKFKRKLNKGKWSGGRKKVT